MGWVIMVKYIEISKHTLKHEPKDKLKLWLWYCYELFITERPSSSIEGDNIVIIYASDFHELCAKSEAYSKLLNKC